MSVVARRAEVAEVTAQQVERLIAATPVDDDWLAKATITRDEAELVLRRIARADTYADVKDRSVRVVTGELWAARLPGLCARGDGESLLAATSPSLATSYESLARIQLGITKLKSDRTALDKGASASEPSEAERDATKTKRAELDEGIERLTDSYDEKVDRFVEQVRGEASKADATTKRRLAPALTSLRRAVNDAKLNNSVALLRYPLAIPTLPEEAGATAKRLVADIVEEQTGTRPDLGDLKPQVKIDGTDVKLTIAGLQPTQLLGLKPDDVIKATAERLTAYVERVVTLVARVDETQRTLDLQGRLLDAWLEGLGPSAETSKESDLDSLKVTVAQAATSKEVSTTVDGRTGRHLPAGIRDGACPASGESVASLGAGGDGGGAASAAANTKPMNKRRGARPSSSAQPKPKPPAVTQPSAEPKRCDVVLTNQDGSFCL